jgi:hypothetical protein
VEAAREIIIFETVFDYFQQGEKRKPKCEDFHDFHLRRFIGFIFLLLKVKLSFFDLVLWGNDEK